MGYSPQKLFEESKQGYGVSLERQAFWVVLHFNCALALGAWSQQPRTSQEIDTVGKILQCFDTIFKHAMSANWIAVEKDPNTFYLKEDQQRYLLFDGRGGRPDVFAQYYVRIHTVAVLCVCIYRVLSWTR
jgi:hypothetical protein